MTTTNKERNFQVVALPSENSANKKEAREKLGRQSEAGIAARFTAQHWRGTLPACRQRPRTLFPRES